MENNIVDDSVEMTNSSKVYALFYSFFLIPFMLAIFGAMFFFMFQFLTYEKSTPSDLLNNIQSGSATKRWQSAFELSNMLSPEKIVNPALFENRLKNLFEKSKYDDLRVRTYLALAMGKTQNPIFGPILIEALKDENESVRIASIKSLGILRYKESCDKFVSILSNSSSNSEKLACIISLGAIGEEKYSNNLVEILDDEEPNLRWDAAIALLKMGNEKGVPIVKNLLSRDYYKQFPPKKSGEGMNDNEIDIAINAAIAASSIYIDDRFRDELLFLSKSDKNIAIRELALKTIDVYYK